MQVVIQTAPFGLTGLLGATSLGAAIGSIIITPVCFAEGARILTDHGYVEVERLKAGDTVITADGSNANVRWLGQRRLSLSTDADRERLAPVRIKAGALAEATPLRDLLVSPNHALCIDGVLVSAISLVNGVTVTRAPCEEIAYYHVECDKHVLLVSEGAPSESYLDTGSRSFFANADVPSVIVQSTPSTDGASDLAAPRATREQVTAIRRAIRLRAEAAGLSPLSERAAERAA